MSTTVERKIAVPGDRDEVFVYVANFANTAEWDPGIVEASQVGDGPIEVGTEFDVVARFMGREVKTRYRITEYERPQRVALVGGTSNFTSTDIVEVHDEGEALQIHYRATFELNGVLRLAEPFLKGTFNRLADDAVGGLRKVLSS